MDKPIKFVVGAWLIGTSMLAHYQGANVIAAFIAGFTVLLLGSLLLEIL